MGTQYLYGQMHLVSRKRGQRVMSPVERSAVPATGRIVVLLVGQGIGFIRLDGDRKIFFHRSDVEPGTSINDFKLGDAVEFNLVEDFVSGARALRVRHRLTSVRRLFAVTSRRRAMSGKSRRGAT